MTAAFERGDIDEASRLGVLAGPVVIEQGLAAGSRAAGTNATASTSANGSTASATASTSANASAPGANANASAPGANANASARVTSGANANASAPGANANASAPPTKHARTSVLAAIAAAPAVEARAELLPSLASVAQSGDRRVAIPAAQAARTIARELARAAAAGESSDDIDSDDVATWRALFDAVARSSHRFIEVRVLALDTVAALALVIDPRQVGFDLTAALADPDPAYRAIAVVNVPRPTPASARAPLANAVKNDADDAVALAAAQVLCGDDRAPAVAALGGPGLDRVKTLVAGKSTHATRDARRCLEKK